MRSNLFVPTAQSYFSLGRLTRQALATLLLGSVAACTSTAGPEKLAGMDINAAETDNVATPSNHPTTDFFMNALKARDYVTAASKFDRKVKASLSTASLGQLWEAQLAQLGPLQQWNTVRKVNQDGYDINIVAVDFEKGRLKMTLTAAASTGEISGIVFAPESASAGTEKKTEFPSEKVGVGQSPLVLDGEIIYPSGPGPFPGVVLVHGSGPQNMNSSIGPNAPFFDIAEGLAARGIAVLRYHKRYHQYPEAAHHVTVKDEVIDDAVAAVALLKTKKRIQPQRIFILGHSLGAQLAPEIGVLSQPVSGLVLLAPPGRTPRQYIGEQLLFLGSPPEMIATIERDFLKLESGQAEGIKILGVNGSYWQDLYTRDGISMAKKLARPVLVLRGDRDYQVTDSDIEIWRQGLKGSRGFVASTLPGLNHLFIKGEGKAGPQDYKIPGRVDPLVLDTIATFIKGGD